MTSSPCSAVATCGLVVARMHPFAACCQLAITDSPAEGAPCTTEVLCPQVMLSTSVCACAALLSFALCRHTALLLLRRWPVVGRSLMPWLRQRPLPFVSKEALQPHLPAHSVWRSCATTLPVAARCCLSRARAIAVARCSGGVFTGYALSNPRCWACVAFCRGLALI